MCSLGEYKLFIFQTVVVTRLPVVLVFCDLYHNVITVVESEVVVHGNTAIS